VCFVLDLRVESACWDWVARRHEEWRRGSAAVWGVVLCIYIKSQSEG
jgi:hypothetical protein